VEIRKNIRCIHQNFYLHQTPDCLYADERTIRQIILKNKSAVLLEAQNIETRYCWKCSIHWTNCTDDELYQRSFKDLQEHEYSHSNNSLMLLKLSRCYMYMNRPLEVPLFCIRPCPCGKYHYFIWISDTCKVHNRSNNSALMAKPCRRHRLKPRLSSW